MGTMTSYFFLSDSSDRVGIRLIGLSQIGGISKGEGVERDVLGGQRRRMNKDMETTTNNL
jgi:hypothetical protein